MKIELIGIYVVDGVEYLNPTLTPMIDQPILSWVWGAEKHITMPMLLETLGARRALNLDKIMIQEVTFNLQSQQDLSVLVGRIVNRMNDFKPQEDDNTGNL